MQTGSKPGDKVHNTEVHTQHDMKKRRQGRFDMCPWTSGSFRLGFWYPSRHLDRSDGKTNNPSLRAAGPVVLLTATSTVSHQLAQCGVFAASSNLGWGPWEQQARWADLSGKVGGLASSVHSG